MRLAFMSVLEIVSNLYGNLPWGNLLQSLLVCLTLKPPVGKTVWTSPEFWNVLKELEKRVASSLPQAVAPLLSPGLQRLGQLRSCLLAFLVAFVFAFQTPDIYRMSSSPPFIAFEKYCLCNLLMFCDLLTIISCSCENPQSCSLFLSFPHFMYPVC